MNINVSNDSKGVIGLRWIPGEHGPVWMVGNSY